MAYQSGWITNWRAVARVLSFIRWTRVLFGHEHMSDRVRILLWSHQAFNRLPRHVRSLDVGGFQAGGGLISLCGVEEFSLLTEYTEGQPYALISFGCEAGTDFDDVCLHGGKVGSVVRQAALGYFADILIIGSGVIQEPFGRFRSGAYEIVWEAPCPVISV
jgi:hypothetical protein